MRLSDALQRGALAVALAMIAPGLVRAEPADGRGTLSPGNSQLSAGKQKSAALPLPPTATIVRPPAGAGIAHETDAKLPADYVEEEFLMSGRGRVFGYDELGEAKVIRADEPYTTRLLVRRPRDPRRASGWAFVEPLHPEIGRSFAWRQSRDYFARSGDVWIGVTTMRNLDLYGIGDPLKQLRAFDAVRYADVSFGASKTEGGLTWDVIAAAGSLARGNALTGNIPVRRTVIGGWSGAGALTLFFANTFHARERRADGGPIFDAILLGEPGWYPRINAATGDIMAYDVRQSPAFLDVPQISISSSAPIEFGMPFRPRADSDAADARYRAFDIAGANHRGRLEPFGGDLRAICQAEMSDFPLDAYYSLTIDWLKRWADKGEAPPLSQPISIDRFGKIMVDEVGNPLGGVRSPELEAPVARYYQTHDAPLVACRGGGRIDALPRAELERRYGNKAGYVAAVKTSAAALVRAGWLLPADSDASVRRAEAFTGFDRQ